MKILTPMDFAALPAKGRRIRNDRKRKDLYAQMEACGHRGDTELVLIREEIPSWLLEEIRGAGWDVQVEPYHGKGRLPQPGRFAYSLTPRSSEARIAYYKELASNITTYDVSSRKEE